MRAGIFKYRINVYREVKDINEYGEEINGNFELVYSTRAQVYQISGNRELTNDNVNYNYKRIFKVRHYVDIREYDKIEWKGQFYTVLNIDIKDDENGIIISTELVND